MRMIVKEFILQSDESDQATAAETGENDNSSGVVKSALWVECHERIARYHIIMDNYMRQSEPYLEDHAQQNQEQTNNTLKTCLSYYQVGPSQVKNESESKSKIKI